MARLTITHLLNQSISYHPVDGAAPFACVENPGSQHAHFSLCVRAGHYFDPEDNQGLAHLLEHVLFLGSRQLPSPNQIIQFIEERGGSVNAWTTGEFANFHFSCLAKYIDEAIPVFLEALFFPLLKEQKVANEIKAIDAEFKFKRKDELRRLYQIHKETCNPEHPFRKFSVGNAELFNRHPIQALRAQLRDFHQHYYNKRNIRIAISLPNVQPASIDLLTRTIANLPEGETAHCAWPLLYREQDLGLFIQVKPIQHAKRLIVTFSLQTDIAPIKKALQFISHILGDESEGSLLACLKKQEYASSLLAGSGIESAHFKDFNINIQLTDKGELYISKVLGCIAHTLRLIENNLEQWRIDEKENLDNLAIKYSETTLTLDNVCELSECLFDPLADKIDEACKTSDILFTLGLMSIENLRVKLISPNALTQKQCRYYDASYSVQKINEDFISAFTEPNTVSAIRLPQKNPFVFSQPIVEKREAKWETPTNVSNDPFKQVWFCQDDRFNSVKGDLYCSFDIPTFSESVINNAAKRVWLGALNDRLQESLYSANVAGLHYRLYGHQCGFTAHCRGFTEALLPLAQQVVETTFTSTIDARSFDKALNNQHNSLANSLLNKPINRLFSRLSVIVQKHSFAPASLLQALPDLDFYQFESIFNRSFATMYCESLLHGNWSIQHAKDWQNELQKLNLNINHQPLPRSVIKLESGRTLVHRVPCEHTDSAVVLYLQAPTNQAKDRAFCMILEQLLAGPYFNALRTEQQRGYLVGSGYVPHNQHPGIVFYVQSPQYDVNTLVQAMIVFLREQIHNLNFYQNYWPSIRNNLLKQIDEPDLNLSMQSQRIWLNLGTGDVNNSAKKELISAIENMSFEALVHGAELLLQRNTFGELILYSPGKFVDMGDDVGVKMTNLEEFKSKAAFFN